MGYRKHEFIVPIIFGYSNVVSASYADTASYAIYAVSASYAVSSSHSEFADDAFFATSASTADFSISSSHALNADNAISASYAETASYSFYAETANSASYAQTASTANYSISSSHALNADNSISASYAETASYSFYAEDANSASYAQTASYIDEKLDRYNGGSGSYTTINDHKFGLVMLYPTASSTTVFLDGTNYVNEEYLSIINKTGNELIFSGSNAALIYSEGAVSGSDGKLKNNKSNTTVTCLYDGTNWEIVGKLSL